MLIPDPYPVGGGEFECGGDGGDVKFYLTGFPTTLWNLKNKDCRNLAPLATLILVFHRRILLTV